MIDTRIKLSILWISHFLIWTFGDVLRLFQGGYPEAPTDLLIALVAAPLGIIQVLLITFTVVVDQARILKNMRVLHMIFGVIYTLIDIGHIFDVLLVSNLGLWELELVAIYLLFDFMIIKIAYQWKIED